MSKYKFSSVFLGIIAIICFILSASFFVDTVNGDLTIVMQKQVNYELQNNYALSSVNWFGENSLKNNGLLLYTTDEGAEYALAKEWSKEFSLVALPIATDLDGVDLKNSSAVKNVTADFSQVIFNFVDANGQVLTIKLLGVKGSSNIANELISYSVFFNGKDMGISGTLNQSFRSVVNGKVNPIYFYANTDSNYIAFDKAGEKSSQKIDLSSIVGLDLQNYSVNFSVGGLANAGNADKSAKIVLLELCGQELSGENVKPIINQYVISNGIVGSNYNLPEVYAYDVVNCENVSDNISFTAEYNGNSVNISNGKIKLEKAGKYEIVASLTDGNNILNSVSKEITVFSYKPSVNFELSGEVVGGCKIYDTVEIPTAKVSSDLFLIDLPVSVSIVSNGKVIYCVEDIQKSFEYKFNVHGDIFVVYSVIDYFGYFTDYTVKIEVENVPNLQNISLPERFSLNKTYNLVSPVMIFNGVNCNVYTEVVTPSGKILKDVNSELTVDELGAYKFTYYTLVEGKQHTFEYDVESVLTSESIISKVNDIVSVEADCDLPEYSMAGNGVKILGEASGASFTFNNAIDFTEFTKDDTVISLQVLNTVELSKFNKVIVTLTDINDASNKIQVRMLKNNSGNGADQWSYVTTKYKGSFAGISNSGASSGNVQKVDWGGTVNWCSFSGLKYSNCTQFSFSLDYESKCIYTKTGIKGTVNDLVLDLDDANHVGVGNEWYGFSEGKAYLTITIEGLTSTGGIIVTNVANNSLSGAVLTDNVAPKIYLSTDKNFQTMPKGEKGTKYPLPQLFAWDMIDTQVETQISLYKGSASNLISYDVADLSFVPTESGTYYVEYKAVDDAGNVASKTVSFEVVDKIESINAIFKSTPQIAKVGDTYTIPEIQIVGGSSIVSVKEKVLYNGMEIEISNTRSVRLSMPGQLKVEVEVVDYLGNAYNSTASGASSLSINVVSADLPIIEVENVPIVAYKGDKLVLPQYNAYNGNKEQNGVSKKVEVNGNVVTDTMEYQVTEDAGTILTVKYYAIAQEVNVRTFEVLVIDPEYVSDYLVVKNLDGTLLNAMDNLQVNLGKEYLEYVFEAGKEIYFPQNIVADSLNVKLGVNPLYSDFDYFDIYLKDSYDKNNVIFLRVCKDGYLEVNGDSNDRIKINGSFVDDKSYFYFIYDNAKKELLSEDGRLITRINRNVGGFKFNGFSASLANVSIVMPENASSSIRIMQMANQTFMSSFSGGVLTKYNDKTGPLVRFENKMESKTILKGESIFISKATAHDVFKTTSTVNVTLTNVDTGKVIFDKVSCLQDMSYTPSKCGAYEVKYVARDSSKRETPKSFYVVVKEQDAPVIENKTSIKEQYSVNDSISYINATVTDENAVKYYMLVLQPNSKYIVVKENEQYKFTAPGKYKVVLYAEDAYFNVSKLEYDITVKG